MVEWNRKINRLEPYTQNTGEFSLRLDANESFLQLPEPLRKRCGEIAATLDYRRYPDSRAEKVCEAFAAYYDIAAGCVTAGNGSDELISIIISAFLEKGDKAVTVTPDFSMYEFYMGLSEVENDRVAKSSETLINVEELIDRIRESDVKLVIFSNPCNPTGRGLERAQVRKIIQESNALVVLDEAYMDFWNQSLLTEAEAYDNLIILKTCSKAFGLAAVRLGFAVSNPKITRILHTVKSPYNVNALTQEIGAYLLGQRGYLKNCTQEIITSREMLYREASRICTGFSEVLTVEDSVANFILFQGSGSGKVWKILLQNGIAVRKMNETVLRVTAGSREENKCFLKTLSEILVQVRENMVK